MLLRNRAVPDKNFFDVLAECARDFESQRKAASQADECSGGAGQDAAYSARNGSFCSIAARGPRLAV
jgi:hypothetical protein